MMQEYIDFSKEVKEALENNRPVVALETAGTFEGFGYPDNMKLAADVSEKIREIGAAPAYIGISSWSIREARVRLTQSWPNRTRQ